MLGALDGLAGLDGRDGVGVREGDDDRALDVLGVFGVPDVPDVPDALETPGVPGAVESLAVDDEPPPTALSVELADTVPEPVADEAPAFT